MPSPSFRGPLDSAHIAAVPHLIGNIKQPLCLQPRHTVPADLSESLEGTLLSLGESYCIITTPDHHEDVHSPSTGPDFETDDPIDHRWTAC